MSRATSARKIAIEVFDTETNIKTIYSSMAEAVLKMGVPSTDIKRYFYQNTVKPYKGRYIMKKI